MFLHALLLAGCSAASNLPEDLLDQDPTPPGERYDRENPVDFGNTGVAVSPRVPHVLAPARLRIDNRSGETLACLVDEDPQCPSLGDLLDPLDELAPGERWVVFDVECALLDIACLPVDYDDRTVPLRTWSWFVEPVDD